MACSKCSNFIYTNTIAYTTKIVTLKLFLKWNQRNRPFLSEAFCGNEESDWLLREAEVITITHLFSNQWHTAVSGEGVKGVVPMTQENQSEFTKMPQLIKVTITLLVNWIFLYTGPKNIYIFFLPKEILKIFSCTVRQCEIFMHN